MHKTYRKAFSLIEISIVLIVVGLIVAGIAQSDRLMTKAALTSARSLTKSSPVLTIDGVVLWLDATASGAVLNSSNQEAKDNDSVAKWIDTNPVNTSGLIEGTAFNTPVYKEKAIGNLPAIVFKATESDYFKLSDGSFPTGNSPYTVFVVLDVNVTSVVKGIISSGYTGGTFPNGQNLNVLLINNGSNAVRNSYYINNAGAYAAENLASSLTLSGKSILTASYDGTVSNTTTNKAYFNGSAITLSGTAIGTAKITGSTPVYIGAHATSTTTTVSGTHFDGNMGEIIIFNKNLSDEDRKDVEKYLSKKWKIAVSG